MKKEDILFNGAETEGDTNDHWGGRIVFKASPGEFLIGNASNPNSFFLPRRVKGSLVNWEVKPDSIGDSICGYLLTAKENL